MLVYFYYLDKNPGWVTDGYGYDDFPKDFQTYGQPVDVPMKLSFRERSFRYTSAISRLCLSIRDVINTCDDTIYNLSIYVCD